VIQLDSVPCGSGLALASYAPPTRARAAILTITVFQARSEPEAAQIAKRCEDEMRSNGVQPPYAISLWNGSTRMSRK
jgi:hypothetical protein